MKISKNESIESVANQLVELDKNVILIFAFNGTGKTWLSVEYKDITKQRNGGNHAGVYYNAYSEDLFVWENDPENEGLPVRLKVTKSTLNQYHSMLDESKLREKLSTFKPKFNFVLTFFEDTSQGIDYISFYSLSDVDEEATIKISRGEERVFVWCLYLALFDIQGWTGQQKSHFFIDDPVSSLDDHNIFITASTLMDLIDEHCEHRKIIITTHHIGLFSILSDWLTKGEKSSSYKNITQMYILKKVGTGCALVSCKKDVFLYHLELLQLLQHAVNKSELYTYHFALFRQVLENISSFLGVGRITYVLEQIGIDDADKTMRILHTLSHKNVFKYETKELVPDNIELFLDLFGRVMKKYNFVIHVEEE